MEAKITKNNTKEVKSAIHDAIEKGLTMIGMQAEGYAKLELENAPRRVDTGLLRNSITYAISGKPPAKTEYKADKGDGKGKYNGNAPTENGISAVYIGTNVEYAPYVHEGTSKMSPNRFLKNAGEKHKDEYERIMETTLKG